MAQREPTPTDARACLRSAAGRARQAVALRRFGLFAGSALAAAALATAASGQQVPDPFQSGEQQTEDLRGTSGQELDTDYTPTPKDGRQIWKQIAGAEFTKAAGESAEQSVGITRYDDNLFAVSFRTMEHGLVGGARCGDPDDESDFQKSSPDPGAEEDCVPVLYRYTDDPVGGKPKTWEQVRLPGGVGDPGGDERPGYIGAIAWIDADRALIVGGTGTYPRREPPYGKDISGTKECQPPAQGSGAPYGANCDQAGMARVWLLRIDGTDDRYCELRPGEDNGACPPLPEDDPATPRFEGMRGLTALDFHGQFEDAGAAQPALGFAGGLGQLWRWYATDQRPAGGFDTLYDNDSPQAELEQSGETTLWIAPVRLTPGDDLFNFRVRALRFVQHAVPAAFAVTSGCCSGRDVSTPLVLRYSERAPGSTPEPQLFGPRTPGKWTVMQQPLPSPSISATPGSTPEALPPQSGAHQSGLGSPDSLYSLVTRCCGNVIFPSGSYAALGAQASTDSAYEPPQAMCALGRRLSSARFVAIDGSGKGFCPAEWAAGELRSRRAEGRGRRGLLFPLTATHPAPTDVDTAKPDAYAQGKLEDPVPPTDQERLAAHLRSFDLQTDSYSLNALDMVGTTGTGYAVGDHGAIVALSSAETRADRARSEPDPPRLGARTPGRLSDRSPYDSFRRQGQDGAGGVPPLAGREREQLSEPGLFGWGSPDPTNASGDSTQAEDVSEIVMSRDGREGWAVGPHQTLRRERSQFAPGPSTALDFYGVASLYHFDGGEWRRCDSLGVAKQLDPDPACASVAGLREYQVGGDEWRTVKLIAAARVPLERDSDPSNDDEFEVVAIGTYYRGRQQPADDDPVILHYRHGRWSFEERERRLAVTYALPQAVRAEPGIGSTFATGPGALALKDVAFTAPDDGWILARQSANFGIHRLFHFDGERWQECLRAEGGCGSLRVPRAERDARLRLLAAGERVYIYGHRFGVGRVGAAGQELDGHYAKGLVEELVSSSARPVILYRERGGRWTDGSAPGEDGAGYDPGCVRFEEVDGDERCVPDPASGQGHLYGLTVTQRSDGRYEGLAVGRFSDYAAPPAFPGPESGGSEHVRVTPVSAILMRLARAGGRYRWETFRDPGALEDSLWPQLFGLSSGLHETSDQARMTLLEPAGGGAARALVAQRSHGRLLAFKPERERFELVPADLPQARHQYEESFGGNVQALAPDGQGGAWLALKNTTLGDQNSANDDLFFYHYTDRPQQPVLRETPHPFGERDLSFTALASARDGSLWLGSDTATLAHYDRLTGWETLRIPGWEPGRVVTRESAVNALALGPDGRGVAVGDGGRVANLGPEGAALDAAAGTRCVDDPEPPCGTSRELSAAAVAPDGSALVGGDALALLWRPPGAGFREAPKPPGGAGVAITGVSMPTPERAYASTDSGYVYVGEQTGEGDWSWRAENLSGRTVLGSERPLRAIAVNAQGRGYAVGDRGLVLYRTGEGRQPWKRIRAPGFDHLVSVTLALGAGESGLIGGRHGLVLSAEGERLALARPGEFFTSPQGDSPGQGPSAGPAVGLALLPGAAAGQAEAWAAVQARGRATNRLFHYASDESEPLLRPQGRAEPLPDAPARRAGELAFAAFGKSECDSGAGAACPPMTGAAAAPEVIARRVGEELRRRASALDFSLFTGDVSDSAGYASREGLPLDTRGGSPPANNPVQLALVPGTASPWTAFAGRLKFRRWAEMVADPIEDSGTPVFGAPGAGDLSRPYYDCSGGGCYSPTEPAKTGESSAWRETMAPRRAPWGKGDTDPGASTPADPGASGSTSPGANALSFSETPGSTRGSQPLPEAEADPDGGQGFFEPQKLRAGARTHYAVEVERGAEKLARIVAVDSSLRSLSASDAIQNPVERDGQLRWLERMLCFEGQVPAGGGECTRAPGQQAIVLSNTPTYSYGPGALDATQTDGAEMERILLRHRASVVVSGRLGWNARYWATAPGVHEPCPGAKHQDAAPEPGTRVCGRSQDDVPVPASPPSAEGLAAALDSLGPPPEPVRGPGARVTETLSQTNPTGLVPFVVAASAGGKFGPNGENFGGAASDGYFHGYTIVRLDPSGDPRGVLVEQRPVLDWVTITAPGHVLRAGQRMRLRGSGREPLAYTNGGTTRGARYNPIDSPAITHRYDLLLADPQKPYLPARDADGDYLPLDPTVATVDRQTGQVRAGRGSQARTYAIALLSVADKAASWPLVFEPGKSFRPKPALTIPLPAPPRAPAPTPPQIRVLGQPPVPPPATPPPPAQLPNLAQLDLPAPPALPSLPQALALNPITPPAPPAPPAPPVNPPAQPLALNALLGQVGVNAAPIPPNAPAVNPAPPSGSAARKEAKQRQAATAKSEEGGSEGAQELGGDLAQGRATPGAGEQAMTRRERSRAEASFTPLSRREQPSAWSRAPLYGGGLGLAAATLALGFSLLRPTPRRRPPEVPAPAYARSRRR